MLERKIQYAEEMILSSENLDKKCALDYIIDSLQYIISIQDGTGITDKYSNASKKYQVMWMEKCMLLLK